MLWLSRLLLLLLQAKAFLLSMSARDPTDLSARYPTASADAIDLLQRMLRFFPEDRITAEEALAHPLFRGIRDLDTEVCQAIAVSCGVRRVLFWRLTITGTCLPAGDSSPFVDSGTAERVEHSGSHV